MTGRQEHQNKIENIINKKIIGKPQYIVDYSKTFNDKTASTKKAYIEYVLEFLDYLQKENNININDPGNFKLVKPSTINGFSSHIRYRKNKENLIENSESIRASKIYAIKHFFDFLYNDGYITDNPSLNISVPKKQNNIKVIALNENEIEILKQNIICGVGSSNATKRQSVWKNRDMAIIMIALVTGLRVEALVEINYSDIDFVNNSINVVEKGNVERTCYIGNNTMDILKKWIFDRSNILKEENNEALFISSIKRDGKHLRMTTSGVRKLVKKYSYNIDKKITPHKLRSTCATTAYKHTGDIYLTASIIGHKNIQNTRRYALIEEEERQSAANKLDCIFN